MTGFQYIYLLAALKFSFVKHFLCILTKVKLDQGLVGHLQVVQDRVGSYFLAKNGKFQCFQVAEEILTHINLKLG